MELQNQDLLSCYQRRLVDELEPNDDLYRHLVAVASFQSDELQALMGMKQLPKEVQVESLLSILRKHHDGVKNLVKGLLLIDKHQAFARDILEDENFEEYDIRDLLEDMEDKLNEVQILRLELLWERKKHNSTKRELEEVKSNRNSLVFSDYDSSYCSGFDGSDTDTMTGYLLRELEEEKKRREQAEYAKRCHEKQLHYLSKKNRELEESQGFLLRHFKSLEDIKEVKEEVRRKRFPRKAASVSDLCLHNMHNNEGSLSKWKSDDSGARLSEYSRYGFFKPGVLDLAEKVSNLEVQLIEEKEKRFSSETEITKLESENTQLQFKLEETRDHLSRVRGFYMSHDNMSLEHEPIWDHDYDEDMDMGFDVELPEYNNYDGPTLGRGYSCPMLNQIVKLRCHNKSLQSREELRMRRPVSYHGCTDVSNIWENRNEEHYEMDEYEHEMEKNSDPHDTDLKYILRKLKLKTWNLYHDIVMGSAELKILSNRAERLKSYPSYI